VRPCGRAKIFTGQCVLREAESNVLKICSGRRCKKV